jgi:glycosyltransferase involved in cell wall biosynthesis
LNEIASEITGFSRDLEIYLAGTIEEDVIESINACSEIRDRVSNNGYISHTEVIDIYKNSALLLLVISNTDNASWILPGKMFEYMALRKPILSVGNAVSDASDILNNAGYHECFDYDDKEGMKNFILATYENYKNKNSSNSELTVEKYHRRELTKSLAACLDQL